MNHHKPEDEIKQSQATATYKKTPLRKQEASVSKQRKQAKI
jgi:hypothetical protein